MIKCLMKLIGNWEYSLQAGHHVPVQTVNAHRCVYMLTLAPTGTHTHLNTGTHTHPVHPKHHANVLLLTCLWSWVLVPPLHVRGSSGADSSSNPC